MLILTLADPRAGCVCVSERYIKHLNTLLSSLIPQPKDVESGLRGELRGGSRRKLRRRDFHFSSRAISQIVAQRYSLLQMKRYLS